MNILFCIGKNYRDFLPLNQFAQRFAREMIGDIHQIIFCDSLDLKINPENALFGSLGFSLQIADNLLIVADSQCFSKLLEFIQTTHKESNIKIPPITRKKMLKIECEVENQMRRIWLLDLQNSFENQTESQEDLQCFLESQFGECGEVYRTIFLYLLGLDAISAKILLEGIAKDFEVNLEILNTDSSLEILSATSKRDESLKEFVKVVQFSFGDKIFPSRNLAQSVIALLSQHHLKITAAESCTGGLIAYHLTKESGASNVFDGGVIGYANAIKESWLEVSSENLESFGAVSEAVVREMLEGALKLSGADFALATSGIAGPSGGSASKPIGTIFIGAKDRKGAEIIERLHFKGDRNYIQAQATIYAYLLFLKFFLSNY